jgi:tetratricopeptide (TPR) repeat protein
LLSDRDRALFQQIAVFYGGFTIETAASVCAGETLDELDVLDALTSLADKSLLHADPQDDESMRYRLLESTHEYAREKLAESGELDVVTARHALAYAAVAEELHAKYEELAPEAWLAQAQVEIENVRAALTWAFSASGEALIGQRIAAMLPRVFGIVAANEALRWVKVALERVTDETPQLIVAGLELAHANLASVFNQFNAALTAADCALPLFAALDRPIEVMEAQRLAGRSLVYLGRVEEGESLLQLSLQSRRAQGSTRVGGVLGDLAVARALQGDLPGARALFAQAKASFEERADASKLATTAATLAEAEFFAGDVRAALDLAEQALTCARGLGRHRIAAAILGNLAAYHLEVDEFASAKARAREALQICCDIHPDAVSAAFALQHLAAAATLEPGEDVAHTAVRRARCAHLLGFVESRLEALDVKREPTERRGHEKLCAALQAFFEAGELDRMVAAGKSWSEEHAITESSLL